MLPPILIYLFSFMAVVSVAQTSDGDDTSTDEPQSGDTTPETAAATASTQTTETTEGASETQETGEDTSATQETSNTGSNTGTTNTSSSSSGTSTAETSTVSSASAIPSATSQSTNSSGGEGTTVEIASDFTVAGGRVTTLSLDDADTIESVEILSGPDHGNVTVNPDNTLALVMSYEPEFSGEIDFTYKVTYTDGSSKVLSSTADVETTAQQAGWGDGDAYMLAEDADGNIIVEYGDNHRDVYISGSDDALSVEDIAALEGLSASDITKSWLAAHPEYGGSEDMALDAEAGMKAWFGITGDGSAPSSHWLRFESGYEYDNLEGLIDAGTTGEDELHPIHITSYGEGDKPVLNTKVTIVKSASENIVISDVEITGGVLSLEGDNLLFDNVDMSMIDGAGSTGFSVQNADGFTLHDSSITDVYRTTPTDSSDTEWTNHMSSGLFVVNSTDVLIDNTFFDHNGWSEDYEYDLSLDGGQVPTKFNHNMYIANNVTDLTIRDNIFLQGSSIGAKVMFGAYFEDNVMIDNNIGSYLGGGNETDTDGVKTGSFTLYSGNVVTSAGYKTADSDDIGALSWGAEFKGIDATLIDNVVAHLADPNNEEEIAEKESGQLAVKSSYTPYYNDTTIYNWTGSESSAATTSTQTAEDTNVDGLDTAVLDSTTIQIFTQQLLGDADAGIDDLADFLRAQASGELDDVVDADLIIEFFRTGFGLEVEGRLGSETLRFTPNDLADGIRWDNRLNWSTEDLPGTIDGDSVDLGGNWVNYGGTTVIEGLELGDGGLLTIKHGKLTVEGATGVGEKGGALEISEAGQLWMNGYSDSDMLSLSIDGGRFVNTGDMSGATTTTITDGEAILATDGANYDIEAGSSLSIEGSDAKVGFDGEDRDTAVLRLEEDGLLSLTADSDGFSTIEEFRSGAFADSPNVASGVNLGLGSLEIDVSALSAKSGTYDLISVDEIIGELSDVTLTGLGGSQDAEIVVDYTNDTVSLALTKSGSGDVSMSYIGDESDMDDHAAALWAALTDGQGTFSDSQDTEVYLDDDLVALAS